MPRPQIKATAPQAEFDFEINLPAGMETFTVGFLAAWFKCSDQHWINLVEEGHLKALDLSTPGASKRMLRIPRAELTRYLTTRTAQ